MINWHNLRGWHYYSPGDNFNNEFNHTLPRESDDEDVHMGYCVYILGRVDNCERDDDKDGDEDQDKGVEEDDGDDGDKTMSHQFRAIAKI